MNDSTRGRGIRSDLGTIHATLLPVHQRDVLNIILYKLVRAHIPVDKHV
jgi:hypothetical protein